MEQCNNGCENYRLWNSNKNCVRTVDIGLKLQTSDNVENTGYASALYYLYTNEKVYPDFDFSDTKPRNSNTDSKDFVRLDYYPNPTNSSIHLNSNKEISEYELCDSYGRLQARGLVKNLKTLTLDISNYSKGVYILNVKCGSETITKKVIKI